MFFKKRHRNDIKTNAEQLLIKMGDTARDAKRYVAAAAMYEEVLASNPNNAGIHIQCGHMHKECGEYSIAEEHYLAAKTLEPADADLALQLGHLYKVRGWPQQALDAYTRALALKPGWAEAQSEIIGLKQTGIVPLLTAQAPSTPIGSLQAGKADWFDCHLDEITPSGRLRGWALGDGEPARLSFLVNGVTFVTTSCDKDRPDVQAANKGAQLVGFDVPLPMTVLDGKEHTLEIRDIHEETISFIWQASLVSACHFARLYERPVISDMDGYTTNMIKGWVLAENQFTRELQGGCDVLVTCDNVTVDYVKADRYRADVGAVTGEDSNCGYQFVPHTQHRKAYPQTFRFFLLPERLELKGSPLTTSFIDDVQAATVFGIIDDIEAIHRQLTKLRMKAQNALPQTQFNLADYNAWAQRYFPALRRHVEGKRVEHVELPLVSIIMPAYKPLITDFTSAVASVLAQTYQNWELIIVDDGSNLPELTARIRDFEDQDKRIIAITSDENSGISAATNMALAAARGEWIAFFDHDDLLVDVAIELMINAALEGGAKVLYSDEDKIDPAGRFLEPAFKPDWNNRLALNVNYVCHLLVVERNTLLAVGPFDRDCDGAQDHDLILRLSEQVLSSEIRHVQEVLYHWRMTASSTAFQISAKPYAIEAGIRAVTNHLNRTGRPAKVTNVLNSTLYHIAWKHTASPAVSIIIPFRDNVAVTKRCLEHIYRTPDYKNFEVVLVDNWSTDAETRSFIEDVGKIETIRVIRVEETFNYSRLNNLAVETCQSEFLFFMNNDLFVSNTNWLRTVVDEALSDPDVAIVGGKFYYPNGRIQHAGVVLGIGGVAGHVHSGRPKDDGGYAGRASFVQELSAVTGAGMLVRAEVFKAVGGFDEVDLKIAFNDIDLCLKVRAAGFKVVWTPDFLAEHHESLSRGSDDVPHKESRFFHENQVMADRWGQTLQRDPFYNPHFRLNGQPFFDLNNPELQIR